MLKLRLYRTEICFQFKTEAGNHQTKVLNTFQRNDFTVHVLRLKIKISIS